MRAASLRRTGVIWGTRSHIVTVWEQALSNLVALKVTGVDSGTATYEVSYAGDAHLSASAASASATVYYNGS
jgi:hypothetical protein